jgi:ADP-ribosylglycohydrolase
LAASLDEDAMLGAVVGDIVGSVYEAYPIKTKDFTLFGRGVKFTDDTVCSVAVAEWLLDGGDIADILRRYVRTYPRAGYGGMFFTWGMSASHPPYNSWGNGSAMRAGPVGHAFSDLDAVVDRAARSAACSHDHPEGIKGAQAVAAAVRLAIDGAGAGAIREEIGRRFGYDMSGSVDTLRAGYAFDVSCSGTVPPAIIAVAEATDFEDAVRNAVSFGGDSDTLACIAGAVAEPLYGIPKWIAEEARARLDEPLSAMVDRFEDRFGRYEIA